MNNTFDAAGADLLMAEIRQFSSATLSGSIVFEGHCPYCDTESHPGSFSQHAHRLRKFYVISSGSVFKVKALLPRWKCHLCNRTFTEYPKSIIPRRRYTLPQINVLLESLIHSSYRLTVRVGTMPIFHCNEPTPTTKTDDFNDENGTASILSHTSLYRWRLAMLNT